MEDEVERLITAPYKEIVEKGNLAVENSKDVDEDPAPAMLKAAQSLIKEGDRALKKIEPLCNKHLAEYGPNFVTAVKENDDISKYRYELENLLWDFDDYIELENFDAGKFDELQKASRTAAPKVLDILKRMRLSVPHTSSRPVSDIAGRSIGTASIAGGDGPATGLIIGSSSPIPLEPLSADEPYSETLFSAVAGPDQGLDGNLGTGMPQFNKGGSVASHFSTPASERPSGPPPTPPSSNPWDPEKAPLSKPGVEVSGAVSLVRRPLMAESPILHPMSSRGDLLDSVNANRLDDTVVNQDEEEETEWRLRAASRSTGAPSDSSRSPNLSHRWTNSTQDSCEAASPTTVITPPDCEFPQPPKFPNVNRQPGWQPRLFGSQSSFAPPEMPPPACAPPPVPDRASLAGLARRTSSNYLASSFDPRQSSLGIDGPQYQSRKQSIDSVNSSVLDVLDYPSNPTTVVRPGPRTSSLFAVATHGYTQASVPRSGLQIPQPDAYESVETASPRTSDVSSAVRAFSSTISQSLGLEVAGHSNDSQEKIVVDNDEYSSGFNRNMPLRQFDCSIGPHSSFYRMKGFCKGAEETLRGNASFKKVKRPVGGFAMTVVGKCTSCLFELDWKTVECEAKNDSTGNYVASDVGYRVRVLQKCHLASKSPEEPVFGCPFCIQLGETTEESDATVFFSQKDFFAHLARHPRPLPTVAGLTVIESEEVPPYLQDNFDLHFPRPPAQSVMIGIAPEISKLPTAITTDTKKSVFGVSRNTPDRAPTLQFAIGARIVGVEFPDKYNGRWGIGWHDGVRAAFEADAVHLEAPPKDEVRMRGDSSLQAVAKWKWNQKGEDKWLRLDKGDVIKNISWVYHDHWCWSGQNSRGHAGIFPASHIDRVTLKSVQPGDVASVTSEKKSSFSFGLRRTTDRLMQSSPPSGDGIKPKQSIFKIPSLGYGKETTVE